MENKSHAIAAGIFVLAVSALLLAFAMWLTRDTSDLRVFEISSREGVTGLQPQAAVRYKGVLVGRVTAIELDKKQPGYVLVRIAVNDEAPITRSTYAALGFQGLTGLAFIQLDDTGDVGLPLAGNNGEVPRIPMRAGLMSRLSDQGTNLLIQLEQASQRVNALLAPENQKNVMTAIGNLGQAAAGIQQLTARADRLLDPQAIHEPYNIPRVISQVGITLKSLDATTQRLGDTTEAVKSSADSFKRIATRVTEPGGTLDKIAQSTDALATTGQALNATVVPRLGRTADDASRAARSVGRVADAVGDNPQSLLWGRGAPTPGPGESGFSAPAAVR